MTWWAFLYCCDYPDIPKENLEEIRELLDMKFFHVGTLASLSGRTIGSHVLIHGPRIPDQEKRRDIAGCLAKWLLQNGKCLGELTIFFGASGEEYFCKDGIVV